MINAKYKYPLQMQRLVEASSNSLPSSCAISPVIHRRSNPLNQPKTAERLRNNIVNLRKVYAGDSITSQRKQGNIM